MARKFFRKFMPSAEKVESHWSLRWLKPILKRPYLWHLNRHSVSKALALGFFWAMLPIPLQTIPAAFMTLKVRGNVPLAVAATWISNPITLIPHWWTAYTIGKFILRRPDIEIHFTKEFIYSLTWHWFFENFWNFYLPLFLGSIIEGLALGALGYLFANNFWKWNVKRKWKHSRANVRPASLTAPSP